MDLIGALVISFMVALIVTSIGFLYAMIHGRRYDVIDVIWGVLFVVIAWVNVLIHPPRTMLTIMLAVLVTLWGARLSRHILGRWIRSTEEDKRYVELRQKWSRRALALQMYLRVYVVQALLATIISLPVIGFASAEPHFDMFVPVGVAVWIVGFCIEAAADQQLRNFLADTKNRGTLMRQGLWRYSRHPNYFGEMLLWWGIGIVGLGQAYGVAGLVGPIVITGLLLFVSGVPLAEKAMASKPAWREYKARTSMVVLWPPR